MRKVFSKIENLSAQEKKGLWARALKLFEEGGELSEAVLASYSESGMAYKNLTTNDILEESCDVVIVALSIAFGAGFTIEDIELGLSKKADKWQKHQLSLRQNKK